MKYRLKKDLLIAAGTVLDHQSLNVTDVHGATITMGPSAYAFFNLVSDGEPSQYLLDEWLEEVPSEPEN